MAPKTHRPAVGPHKERQLCFQPPSPTHAPSIEDHDVDESGRDHAQLVGLPSQPRRDIHPPRSLTPLPNKTSAYPRYCTFDGDCGLDETVNIGGAWLRKYLATLPDFLAELSPSFGDSEVWKARIIDLGAGALHDVDLLRRFHPEKIKMVAPDLRGSDSEGVRAMSDTVGVWPPAARQYMFLFLHEEAKATASKDYASLQDLGSKVEELFRAMWMLAAEMAAWRDVDPSKYGDAHGMDEVDAGLDATDNRIVPQHAQVEQAAPHTQEVEPLSSPARAQRRNVKLSMSDIIRMAEE